jgi:hypothetical protein
MDTKDEKVTPLLLVEIEAKEDKRRIFFFCEE